MFVSQLTRSPQLPATEDGLIEDVNKKGTRSRWFKDSSARTKETEIRIQNVEEGTLNLEVFSLRN